MKRLVYTKRHDLAKIGTELIQAFPAWIKTLPGRSREANCSITGDGETLTSWVPDDQDEIAVAAVVAAHDPTSPLLPALDALKAAIDAAIASAIPLEIKNVFIEWKRRL